MHVTMTFCVRPGEHDWSELCSGAAVVIRVGQGEGQGEGRGDG